MKRKIALFLSFVIILTLGLPVQVFAAGMDKELENAIKIAKTKFTILDDYKFTSSISTLGSKKIFYLNWRSSDNAASININAGIDENGTILNYNRYTPDDYIQTKKLPKLSRQEAKAKAEKYIHSIEPGLMKNLKYEETNPGSMLNSSYNFSYIRIVNGIPFYNDRVTVNVNRDTGVLQDYSRQWSDIDVKVSAVAPISVKDGEAAYKKNLGLKLIYKYKEVDGVLKAYQVYLPAFDNSTYGVDAFTGERRRVFYSNYYGGYGDATVTFSEQKAAVEDAAGVRLNPEELKAVEGVAELISEDEAEKIARGMKFINITEGHKLQSTNFGTSWPEKDEYIWSFYFTKPADETTTYDEYISVAVNARSGVITSFYRGTPINNSTKAKNSREKAKAEADDFLSLYYPQYFTQLAYDKISSENNINSPVDTSFSFIYNRSVNGIPFPDNGVHINYDNVTGTITGFNLNWFNMTFPSEKVLGIDTVTAKLFTDVGLGLQYKFDFVEDINKRYQYPIENTSVVMVYTFKPDKPLIVSATSGALLNYDGSVYKESARVNYTDLKGHSAEKQIMVLAENGVYLEGTKFNPNAVITQLDFLTLLSKTLNYYGSPIVLKSTKEIEDMYAYLSKEGIVKEGEKAPTKKVTREDAVKFLIRALKYEKVADIKGIYSIRYKDKASISPNMTGYVAISSGLGIVDGRSENFKPKSKLTRAESAIMIYNYLQS